MKVAKILLVNGPNLNLLGEREPEVYGALRLEEAVALVGERAAARGAAFQAFQSNHEGALIDFIQENCLPDTGLILNPGGYTHTSVALRDALLARMARFVEVHLSNVHRREVFRHTSYFSDIALGVIAGLGVQGYLFALEYLCSLPEGPESRKNGG